MVPQGSLIEAKNVSIDRPGLIEQRRGFNKYGSTPLASPHKLFNFRDTLLAHYGSSLAYDANGAGGWVAYSGSYSPAANKLHGVEVNKSFYFTTNVGVQKLDSVTGTPSDAGIPASLNGSASLPVGAGTWFTDNMQVAYRVVWAKLDANSIETIGAPSGRITVYNTSGGTKDVDLTWVVPSGITTSHYWQLYRSKMATWPTTDGSDAANDELYLVAQAFYTTGATVSYTDITPEQLLGPFLYTNQGQQGILASNYEPPLCKDIATYKGITFYANTQKKQYLNLTLIGTSMVQDDTITFTSGVNSFTLTAKNSPTATAGQFKVSALSTVSEKIQETANSIVNAINLYASNTFLNAFYTSTYGSAPGRMFLEAREFTTPAFNVTASARGIDYIPNLPTSGATVLSKNDAKPNRIYYSKFGQPDAVPLLNWSDAGSEYEGINRVIALRDSLFVFKQDGLYRLIGDDPASFRFILFDSSCNLRGEETPAVFNNQIMCVTNQGITQISESGAMIIGQRIENKILPLWAGGYPAIEESFGIGYESARKYILFTLSTTTDTYPTTAYVYHQVSNQFTQWTQNATAGIVGQNDGKLYLMNPDEYVRQERKNLSTSDYADVSFSASITGSTSTTVDLASMAGVSVGCIITQGGNRAQVTDFVGLTCTVDIPDVAWTVGACTISEPIASRIRYAPINYGDPSILKQTMSIEGMFNTATFSRLNFGFKSDLSAFDERTRMTELGGQGWGLTPWGTEPWGGSNSDTQVIRTYVPREKQWNHWLEIFFENTDSFTEYGILGFALQYEPISEVLKT